MSSSPTKACRRWVAFWDQQHKWLWEILGGQLIFSQPNVGNLKFVSKVWTQTRQTFFGSSMNGNETAVLCVLSKQTTFLEMCTHLPKLCGNWCDLPRLAHLCGYKHNYASEETRFICWLIVFNCLTSSSYPCPRMHFILVWLLKHKFSIVWLGL